MGALYTGTSLLDEKSTSAQLVFCKICHSDAVKDGEELDHINNRFAIYCFGSYFPDCRPDFSGKFVK